PGHCRVAQARQARGRGRPVHAAEAGGRVRQDGRPLRLDRHGPRLPARRGSGEGEASARDPTVMATNSESAAQRVYVEADAARTFARALLMAHDVPEEDADTVAGCLVHADLRGVDTHGLSRLPGYLDRVRRGLINP